MLSWNENQEERKKAAEGRHRELSRLFREDRLAFERERKRMIRDVIDSAGDEALRCKLLDLQANWDKRMKGAGSEHNRFVLARTFFWDHFQTSWQPALRRFIEEIERLSHPDPL